MTQEGSTMAHVFVHGGSSRRNSENRLARDARGQRPCVAPWALVVTGLAVTLASAAGAHAQQPASAATPYAGAAVPAQQAKPGAEPERLGPPRPAGEGA